MNGIKLFIKEKICFSKQKRADIMYKVLTHISSFESLIQP